MIFASEPRAASHRRRILFVGEAVTLAHVGRPLELARALDSNRYEIQFACGERYRSLVERAGFDWHQLPTLAPDVFMARLAVGKPLYDIGTLRSYVAAELQLLRELQPEMVVGDFRVSLGISTEILDIPYANLCNAHWSPYSTQRFPVPELPSTRLLGTRLSGLLLRAFGKTLLRLQAGGYNALRRAYGLKSVPGIREMYTRGTWSLHPDIPRLAPTANLPDNHHYLGPVTWSPEVPLPEWWEEISRDGRPLVYVTLGSSGDLRTMRDLLAALSRLPVNVALATAGRVAVRELPANVRAADYLPGTEVLKRSALCVFNGGAATGYQALAQSVPLLGLPSNADQFFFMESVERVGAGRLVRPSRATVSRLSRALSGLLDDAEARESARRIQGEIAARPPREGFRRFVEEQFPKPAALAAEAGVGAGGGRMITTRTTLTQRLRALEAEVSVASDLPGRFSFGDGRYTIRVANDLASRKKAYELVYRLYLEKEYAQPHPSKMWLSIFDALPETTTLLVERQAEGCGLKAEGAAPDAALSPRSSALSQPVAVGALTVIFDSPMGLPADELYKPELDALRAQGRRLCEFSSLAVAEEGEGGSAVLVELYSCMSIYAREVMGATDIAITVNPRHASFYRRTLLFENIGPERCYDKVGGAPAVLQRLDFDVQRQSIRREHGSQPESARRSRVLYRLFHPLEDDAVIAEGLKAQARSMTEQELGYFLVAETDLLENASSEQQACLNRCRDVRATASLVASEP